MIGRIFGQYRIVAETGRGSAGTVYRALDETLGREVAIKILDPDFAHPEIVRRFRTEATTLARLNHPAIATIYELFQCGADLLMVMEFVRGETLAALLDRLGPMAPDRAACLVDRLLWGLEHAHRAGIVHRDIKPANVMVTPGGGVKIMDFGIAHIRGLEHAPIERSMLGTPAYMALEQVLGEPVDARADLYSVGVIFYRLLTGAFPFDAGTPLEMLQKQVSEAPLPLRRRRTDLPSWCETLVQRALAARAENRFQSAAEFRRAIAHARGDLVMGAVAPSFAPPEETVAGAAGELPLPILAVQEHTVVLPRASVSRRMPASMIGWGAAAAAGLVAAVFAFAAIDRAPAQRPSGGDVATHPPAAVRTAAQKPPVDPIAPSRPEPLAAARVVPAVSRTVRRAAVETVERPRQARRRTARPVSKTPPARPLKPLVFETKALVANGRKFRERDAQLVVSAEKVRVSIADDGQRRVVSVPSEEIVSISYSRGRDPEWMSPSGPVKAARTGGGVMGFFRGDRHWIAMRTRTADSFVILRVPESSASRILAALESRTGRKAQRVSDGGERKSG